MKKLKLLFLAAFYVVTINSFSQDYDYNDYSSSENQISTQVDLNFITVDFTSSRKHLIDFANNNKVEIERQNENKFSVDMTIILTEKQYNSFDSIVPKLGFVSYKNIRSTNFVQKKEEEQLELNFLISQKISYEQVLSKLSENTEPYLATWKELKAIEEKIYKKEKSMLKYKNYFDTYRVKIKITDEMGSPSSSKVSFVNMPGFEYSILQIETPKSGLSNSMYQGYFLKYLFTKGKSYGTVGAFKTSQQIPSDSTFVSEMFILGFGQDFYSRYLGRGTNKFFNLYSSYTIGGIIATSTTTKFNTFYISPSIGIELFKNKYMLFDTKVSYFLPYDYNRNLRGVSVSAAFNFVF